MRLPEGQQITLFYLTQPMTPPQETPATITVVLDDRYIAETELGTMVVSADGTIPLWGPYSYWQAS